MALSPLRLYALAELPPTAPGSVVVCRTRPNGWMWLFLTLTLVACAFLVSRTGVVRWAGIWIGFWTALLWAITTAAVRRAAHPDAWLARIG